MQRTRKTWNLFCFSRAAFHSVGDTHLNEIVLLFNGDVNYSAVKKNVTWNTKIYSNLERAAFQSSEDN